MKKHILIIDDEVLVVKTLRKLLSSEGYAVTVAQSGQEALEKVKCGEFNLIVCDMRMPQMDGVDTIKEIREYLKKQGKPPVPEIFITGYADEQKYKSAVELKVADYIYKPFEREEFLEVVKKNLDPKDERRYDRLRAARRE
ncbi:MAG: response regulator [Candidatus Omnitrophica bacterium]|nr:response regulator [Candidatus Omnitrophota bacterium]MBU4479516.1 response regulator [Candidatus Omnitrophota bacterium]